MTWRELLRWLWPTKPPLASGRRDAAAGSALASSRAASGAGAPSSRALSGGRASQEREDALLPGSSVVVLAPPAAYDESWRILQADRRFLECLSPARLLEILADLSPEVSRALWDFLRLCNPGWEAVATRPDGKTQDTQAQAALDAFLNTLNDLYGSVDVIFGRLYMAAFLRGALFAELVLDRRGRLPVDLVTPDPITVRFRQVQDPVRGPVWQLGQWQASGFVALDRPTVRYTPVDPFPGSPYGRPLAAPALFVSLFLLAMLHDIRRVVQQQGYPRLDLSLDTEKMMALLQQFAGDGDDIEGQIQAMVDEVVKVYNQLEPDDAYVHTDIVTVNRPVGAVDADSLNAIDGLIAALERMATRALKSMPIMMGLSESNTETQANRQWEVYAAGVKSIQHYAETLLGRLFTLALEAQGIQATVEFQFAELRAAEMLRDAQTEAMQIQNAKAKYDHGWISQDEASEACTGHPADVPEPRTAVSGQIELIEDDGDGQERAPRSEQIENSSLRRRSDLSSTSYFLSSRVKIIPDGASEPLVPVPDEVEISDGDVDRAVNEWDALMPDYAGLLEATVQGQEAFDESDRQMQTRAAGDPSVWTFDARAKRYRNTATGQFIGQRQMTELRDVFVEAKRGAATDLARGLARGDMTLQEFELAFRREIKTTFVDQYALGKGGRNAMTQADWGAVGRMVRDQYEFAHAFAGDIAAGRLSEAQIAQRAGLYFDASTQAFEQGRSASYGVPTLPAYPADGRTACRTLCKCHWSIEETEEAWRCTWVLGPVRTEHCVDCAGNASRWNPLVIPKSGRSRAELDAILEGLNHNGHH